MRKEGMALLPRRAERKGKDGGKEVVTVGEGEEGRRQLLTMERRSAC